MKNVSLKELCKLIGVSRRAIQGYEKAGLVCHSQKTNRGYLLYDETAQKRIKLIKTYQQMGFSLKEICEIIDAPPDEVRQEIIRKVVILRKELNEKAKLIETAEEIISKINS